MSGLRARALTATWPFAAGFDFDLDEVWGPQKAHLRNVYLSRNGGSAGGLESSDSSRSSVSGGGGGADGSSRRRRGRQEDCDDNGERFRASSMHREAEVRERHFVKAVLVKILAMSMDKRFAAVRGLCNRILHTQSTAKGGVPSHRRRFHAT